MKELKNCTSYRGDYCSAGAVCSIVGPPPLIELAIEVIARELGSGGKCWKFWFSNLRSSPMREDQVIQRIRPKIGRTGSRSSMTLEIIQ